MTLIYPVGKFRILHCDGPRCSLRFNGKPNEDVVTVRFHALQNGWRCNNPAPGRPARDLCPDHRLVGS